MPAPFHILIPARYAATRLPGKPLLDLGGKPMIARVLECARRSAAATVTVATDDARIADAVAAAGGRAVMTGAHPSGTDRIDAAAEQLGLAPDAVIVNLQGDEPRMPAALINQVAARAAADPQAALATAAAPLDSPAQLRDPAVVKVVTNAAGYALYFSRAAIPWASGDAGDAAGNSAAAARRHIGIYACRRAYLRRFAAYGACALERRERLEQLRALWHGDRIACVEAAAIPPAGVDTAADAERLRAANWPAD